MFNKQALLKLLGELRTPIFLAGFDPLQARLTVHVHAGCDTTQLRSKINAAVSGERLEVSVRSHDFRQLAFPRSLEHWLKQFDIGEVVHDPTMAVRRARALLMAAKSLRLAFAGTFHGLFFDPHRRTLFVVHRNNADAGTATALRQQVVSALAWAQAAAQSETDTTNHSPIAVQIVADLPNRALVPVEAASTSLVSRIARTIRRWRTPGAVAIAIAAATVPAAASTNNQEFAATNSGTAGEFGVLGGLSVFADGARQDDRFTAAGLELYFGEAQESKSLLRLAAAQVTITKKKPVRKKSTKPAAQPQQQRGPGTTPGSSSGEPPRNPPQ